MAERRTARDERADNRRVADRERRTYEYEEEVLEDEAADADADEDGRGEATPKRRRRGENAYGRISAAAAAEAGLRSVVELIGKQPEGVTAVAPTDDGWLVGVEVLEVQHVPSSSDILAIYEAALDMGGSLVSYRRTKRYARGRGDTSGDR